MPKKEPTPPPPPEIAEQANAFATRFVAFTDALVKKGVPIGVAREEARGATLTFMLEEAERAPCTVCGHRKPLDHHGPTS